MKIQDFCDMEKFESIMDNWAKSTGLATVAVGATVYAKVASGEVTFTADSPNTVDTGYIAVTSGAVGDMVIISNMAQTVA